MSTNRIGCFQYPCRNKASCYDISTNGQYVCECARCFTGVDCTEPIPHCIINAKVNKSPLDVDTGAPILVLLAIFILSVLIVVVWCTFGRNKIRRMQRTRALALRELDAGPRGRDSLELVPQLSVRHPSILSEGFLTSSDDLSVSMVSDSSDRLYFPTPMPQLTPFSAARFSSFGVLSKIHGIRQLPRDDLEMKRSGLVDKRGRRSPYPLALQLSDDQTAISMSSSDSIDADDIFGGGPDTAKEMDLVEELLFPAESLSTQTSSLRISESQSSSVRVVTPSPSTPTLTKTASTRRVPVAELAESWLHTFAGGRPLPRARRTARTKSLPALSPAKSCETQDSDKDYSRT